MFKLNETAKLFKALNLLEAKNDKDPVDKDTDYKGKNEFDMEDKDMNKSVSDEKIEFGHKDQQPDSEEITDETDMEIEGDNPEEIATEEEEVVADEIYDDKDTSLSKIRLVNKFENIIDNNNYLIKVAEHIQDVDPMNNRDMTQTISELMETNSNISFVMNDRFNSMEFDDLLNIIDKCYLETKDVAEKLKQRLSKLEKK